MTKHAAKITNKHVTNDTVNNQEEIISYVSIIEETVESGSENKNLKKKKEKRLYMQ